MKRTVLALLGVVAASLCANADELTFDLKLTQGQLPENARLMRVHQGDAVKLRWTTDRPLILHLHGYDIEKRVAPGPPIEMNFTARATGRFPVHAHVAGGAHDEALAVIEVYPQ